MTSDLTDLLAPISDAAPAGADPGVADPAFQALQQTAKGQIDYVLDGKDEVAVYRPPNWSELRRQALDCLSRARDVRLAVLLLRGMTAQEGAAGFAGGLDYLHRLLERQWEDVHPQPDLDETAPDERYFRRINALKPLAETDGLLRELRTAPIVEARGIGRFSLRQIQLAQGGATPARGEEQPVEGVVQAAIAGDPSLPATHEALSRAAGSLQALNELLRGKLESAAPDLGRLADLLDELRRTLGGGEAVAPDATGAEAGSAAAATAAGAPASRGAARFGSRSEVLAGIDAILAFYRANDPGSPILPLVARLRRLVPLDFVALLREVAPSGVSEFERLADTALPAEPGTGDAVLGATGHSESLRVGSRDAVIETLDAMVDFYHSQEPSSPIPVMLQRVRRLVPLGFVALLKEIAPSGLPEFKQFADFEE